MPLHAHAPKYAIFSLDVQLLYTLFLVTGLLSVLLLIAHQLVSAISYMQKFIYISSVNKPRVSQS